MKKLGLVLLLAIGLQLARAAADYFLDLIKAPDWTYWVPLVTMFGAWFIFANLIIFRRSKPK